jgi:hypothetical protein
MNCKGYLEIDFASYLVLENTINIREDIQQYILNGEFENIPVAIAVNTTKLYTHIGQEEYRPENPISVTNPCFPDDPSKNFLVDYVTLNELFVAGIIGFAVGVDVLYSNNNVIINEPALQLNYVTTDGACEVVANEPLFILDNSNEPAPQIKVTVINLQVAEVSINDSREYSFSITGTFRIDPII